MKDELKNIDSEDASDLLLKIENSFGFKFDDNELINISSFGELCDLILNKIELENSNDCTSQQAFYKLREAISTIFSIEKEKITPTLSLINLFPRENRRLSIKKIENSLGFKLNILRPPHWLTIAISIIFLTSLVTIFFNWQIGLFGFIFSMVALRASNKLGNEFDVKTFGEVAQRMTRENYLKSRRNQKTVNKREVEKVLTEWFSHNFATENGKLTKETRFE